MQLSKKDNPNWIKKSLEHCFLDLTGRKSKDSAGICQEKGRKTAVKEIKKKKSLIQVTVSSQKRVKESAAIGGDNGKQDYICPKIT